MRVLLDNFEDFVTRYTNNLSLGGVFIQTGDPRPIGTQLRLEISLRGGELLIEARGEVAWVRRYDPDQPWRIPGMGIRFRKLTAASKAHIGDLLGLEISPEEVEITEDSAPKLSGPEAVRSVQPMVGLDVGSFGVRLGLVRGDELAMLIQEQPQEGEAAQGTPELPFPNAPRLAGRAMAQVDAKARRGVLTVAGWAGLRGREMAADAARSAGLKVERLVGTAAAAAIGCYAGRDVSRRLLVYHLGRSGFEAAVIEAVGDVFEVRAMDVSSSISGTAIDAKITDHLKQYARGRKGMDIDFDHPEIAARLWATAESVKRQLTSSANADISLLGLAHGEKTRSVDLTARMTRQTFETLIEDLVDSSLQMCDEVLAAVGLGADDIDEVLLSGGQVRTPMIAERVGVFADRAPTFAGSDPELAPLFGANRLAGALERVDAVALVDVLPISLGWVRPDGEYEVLLPQGTRLPRAAHRHASTVYENQERIRIHLFEGEKNSARHNRHVGSWSLAQVPPGPPGRWRFAVRFELDTSGLLSVSAIDQGTGRAHPVVREAQMDQSKALAALRRDAMMRKKALARPPKKGLDKFLDKIKKKPK